MSFNPTGEQKKILGQEPAFLVGVVEAALAVFLSFGVLGLDQVKTGVIVAAVNAGLAVVVAYATTTTLYSALVGFAKALLTLCVTFGMHLTDAQTGAIIALISLVLGAFLRQSSESADTKISNASPGAKKTDLELLALMGAVEAEAAGVDATVKVV